MNDESSWVDPTGSTTQFLPPNYDLPPLSQATDFPSFWIQNKYADRSTESLKCCKTRNIQREHENTCTLRRHLEGLISAKTALFSEISSFFSANFSLIFAVEHRIDLQRREDQLWTNLREIQVNLETCDPCEWISLVHVSTKNSARDREGFKDCV